MNKPNHIIRQRTSRHRPIINLLNRLLTEIFFELDITPPERAELLVLLHSLMKKTKDILQIE